MEIDGNVNLEEQTVILDEKAYLVLKENDSWNLETEGFFSVRLISVTLEQKHV